MKDKLRKASKAHVKYRTKDKVLVPGVTTITNLLNKPYLIKWANDLGLEGIDSTKYRDEAADIGTLAHAMVQAHLQGTELDKSQFSTAQVDLAENALISFYVWEEVHKLEVKFCEQALVSEVDLYGGTVDCYCMLDNVPTLLDFKTGKAIYSEHFVQLAAYAHLLEEHGFPVVRCRILRIGRDESEGFEERTVSNWAKYYQIFDHLNQVYRLKKEVGWK